MPGLADQARPGLRAFPVPAVHIRTMNSEQQLPAVIGEVPGIIRQHNIEVVDAIAHEASPGKPGTTTLISRPALPETAEAICKLLRVPSGSETTVTVVSDNRPLYRQGRYEVIVDAAGEHSVFESRAALMRALDLTERTDPREVAARFTGSPEPQCTGTVAVYLNVGEFVEPEPVFGTIQDVVESQHGHTFLMLETLDGEVRQLNFSHIRAILETEDTVHTVA